MAVGILMVLTGGLAAAAAYSYYTRDLPSPDSLQDRRDFRTSRILDRKGHLLYELFDPQSGKRTSAKLSEVSPYVLQATIAIEDTSFYDNVGISPRGTLRAVWANLRGEEIQGGSTITQQLIKRVLLSPEVTIDRKIQEWILAYQVSQQYSKEQILEWYLNDIPYGNMAYGIEAAAESYFGKSAKELKLAEASMLAGIPQAPSLLSPLVDPAAAKRRQHIVLEAMVKQGYITEQQAEAAGREELQYQPMRYGIEAPHFVMYVRSLLEQRYGPERLYTGGLTITTSIDLDMQHVAERIVRQQVEKLTKSNIFNASLVALRPNSGEILAMVGSVDYFNRAISGQVNVATADRQPGSTFKPITYSAAFLKGWSPGTVLLDDYTVFMDRNKQPYTPKNVDNKWHGPVSVRTALANSMNVPAVKTLQFVGVRGALDLAHQMGITSLDPMGPWDLSITLGGGEVKLLDLVYAYSVLANGGALYGQPVLPASQKPGYRTVDPVAILRVEDSNGKILEEFTGAERSEVLKPQISYLTTSILSDNNARAPLFGTSSPLKLSRPAAVKTGTTDNNRDLWTVGYTPDLVTGVWVGNADNREIAQVLTTMSAAPIWHDFMEEVLAGTPALEFEMPSGLERVEICTLDGLLPNRNTPPSARTRELFAKGTAPTRVSDIHRLVVVDRATGQPATADTPPENREEKVVEVYPPDWQNWAKAAGKLQAAAPEQPAAQPARPVENREGNSVLVIQNPTTGAPVREVAEIRGTAAGKGFASYKVEFGEGLAPTSWRMIGGVHSTPTENGVLERWDTRSLNGLYKIRLTLTEQPPAPPTPVPMAPAPTLVGVPLVTPTPGRAPTPAPPSTKVLEVPVIVDNSPPTVAISFPEENATFKREQRERITITAQASDNHRVAGTDFYVDDLPVGSSSAAQPMVEWRTTSGTHVLRAVARDAAGNEARSKDVKIVIQ